MSLLLAQGGSPANAIDLVGAATGHADVSGVLILVLPMAVDLVGSGTAIAEVWGVVVDANDPASGAFDATAVRLVYQVDPPNRFWPRKSLKPY